MGASSNSGCPGGVGCYADRAYVFERTGGRWEETALLRASDTTGTTRERFGFSVAIHGSRVAVGAAMSNGLYLYERAAAGW